MARKVCKNCIFYEFDYEWDGENETTLYYCIADYSNVTPDMPACDFFQRLRATRYKEKDTECDKCDRFTVCKTPKCDVTCVEDTRRHYVPDYGHKCEKGG